MSGKLKKLKSTKKTKAKTDTSVKNVEKKKQYLWNKGSFLDVLNEDVWDYMNDFDESELK